MSGFVRHTYHFDSSVVRDFLVQAEAMVDEIGTAPDLRAAAFTQAVSLLTARFSVMEQVNAGGVVLTGIDGR